jgi:heterotetrameric sarcosine oxidase gamma subunit
VPELIAQTPLAGHAPLTLADVTLAEATLGPITSIAPFRGQARALAKALKPLCLSFPAPNRISTGPAARLVWTGRDQAFLIGTPPPEGLAALAALTDQTDGWAALRLDGPGAPDVLARLYPLDLRIAAFPVGCAVRAPFNHMSSILIRSAPDQFECLVFRSMARTAWHEAELSLRALAARARIVN